MSLSPEKIAEASLPRSRLLAKWVSAMLGLARSWWPPGNQSLLITKRWPSHFESSSVLGLGAFAVLENSKTVSDVWRPGQARLETADWLARFFAWLP